MRKKATLIIMILGMVLSLGSSLSFAEETASDIITEVQEDVNVIENAAEEIEEDVWQSGAADEEHQKGSEENEEQHIELTAEEKQQLVHEYIEQTVFEIDDEEFKDEDGQFTSAGTSDNYHVTWIAKSDRWSIHTTMFRKYQYRENVYETSKKLYDMIVADGELIDSAEYDAGVKAVYDNAEYLEGYNHNMTPPDKDREMFKITGYDINQYANICVEGGIESRYEFLIEDNYACISFDAIENESPKKQYYRISNPDKIINLLGELEGFEDNKADNRFKFTAGEERKTAKRIIDWDNMTLNSTPMRLIDVLTFEVEVTEKLYHSAFKQIAELGENVQFELKHMEGNPYSEYVEENHVVITVSGSKGEFCNIREITKNWNDNSIYILGNKGYDGKTDIVYTGEQRHDWEMYLYAEGENNEFSSITVKFGYDPIWEKSEMLRISAEGKNIEYIQYDRNPTSTEGIYRNLQSVFTSDQEELIEISRNVTQKARERREALGIKVGDISLRSVSAADILTESINAPIWYDELGKNVKLILYGVTRETLQGKECMPMLRFQGDDGYRWFNWTRLDMDLSDDLELYEFRWEAIEPFDGKKIVEDTSNPELLIGSMLFDDNSFIELMTLKIGDMTVEIKGEDFSTYGKDNLYSEDVIGVWRLTMDDYWEDIGL